MNRQSASSMARVVFVGLLAAGCASGGNVDLVASGAVRVDRAESKLIDLSLPSVHRDGDVLVVSGTVTRKPGVDDPIPEPLQILFLSKDGAVLDELWLMWQPIEIPIAGNRQSSYEVRYAWIPPDGTIVCAVYGNQPPKFSSKGTVISGSGLGYTATPGMPSQPRQVGTPGTPQGGGRR